MLNQILSIQMKQPTSTSKPTGKPGNVKRISKKASAEFYRLMAEFKKEVQKGLSPGYPTEYPIKRFRKS
jgi:hypothetical protein